MARSFSISSRSSGRFSALPSLISLRSASIFSTIARCACDCASSFSSRALSSACRATVASRISASTPSPAASSAVEGGEGALPGGERGAGVLEGGSRSGAEDLHACGARVEEVDRLVRQETAGDVAAREGHGGADGGVLDDDAVRLLEGLGETAEHEDGGLDRRLVDLHRLEAALEGRILFEVPLVLGPGGGRDGAQLAASEGGLEEVGCVAAPLRAAGADDGVRLVDEEDDGTRRGLHLGDDALEAVLELALHAGAGRQRAEVEREERRLAQLLGDGALGDAQRETLDERRLADAGLADDDRVILAAAGEDVDHLTDLRLAAEDRIELAVEGALGEVGGEAG